MGHLYTLSDKKKMKIIAALALALAAEAKKGNRTPDMRVEQLHGKIEDVMANHFSKKNGGQSNWAKKMLKRSRKVADNMLADFDARVYACMESSGDGSGDGSGAGAWDGGEEWDLEREGNRYDSEDPCR